jgi:tetratricopeptide (TPR) repeat protein
MVLSVALAYTPALGSDFLNYDDPWLWVNNPYLAKDAWRAPLAMLFDFSRETRLALGAEYLPVRDLFAWFETRVFGLWAPGLSAVNVALYALSLCFFRGALLRVFGGAAWVEWALLFFALHPVHVESVAWLSGLKDVLALCFVGATLWLHASPEAKGRAVGVPLCALLASFSKSMSVAVLALLLAQDLMLRRRPQARIYVPTVLALGLSLALHLYVGRIVGMIAPPLGGSRVNAFISMGPVWLRYAGLCLAPWHLSIAHDVPARTAWDLWSVAGVAFCALTLLWSALRLRAHKPFAAFVWLWFFAPLAPVSQFLAPLQNHMADRYLWLSVLAPCLLLARLGAGEPLRRWAPVTKALGGLVALALFAFTFDRTVTFSDSVLLFADGTRKTRYDTDAPYQLGKALEELGRDEEAMTAFREVLARAPEGPEPDAKAASNNLARLLARRGELDEAERVLRAALARFPDDPKVRGNLAKVLDGLGRAEEAQALRAAQPTP